MLGVVDEMIFWRDSILDEFRPKSFVFQDAIEKRTRRRHASVFGRENSLSEKTKSLGVSFEATVFTIQVVQGLFTCVAERRMA